MRATVGRTIQRTDGNDVLARHEGGRIGATKPRYSPTLSLNVDIALVFTTEWMELMSHRKRKETKQQPGTDGPGNILGCCFVSLRFLWDIHYIHSVRD